ncbi:MAG: hypothetical protein J1F12_05350 [Muribaculaceae bacterium]|nr:hypothetical protein [Muribaculaceae bacterium]
MRQEEELINRFGKDSGMKVPENYFPDLQKNILNKLPEYPKVVRTVDHTRWQRIKPYVYLAAMFCGIWLMMKVFHTATQPMSMSLDNPPAALVDMIDSDYDYDIHYVPYIPDNFYEDEDFIMSYDNIEDFEKDFDYSFQPEYSTITTSSQNDKNG